MTDLIELYRHWDAGESISEMSNRLGLDRKTIRRYVSVADGAGLTPGTGLGLEAWQNLIRVWFPDRANTRLRRSSWTVFDQHEVWIREQLAAQVTVATIWQRLRDDLHVEGSERSLNRWVADTIGPARQAKATGLMPVTAPGEQGQVDYGLMGTWTPPDGGRPIRIQAWILTLPFSRMDFVWPTNRMRQPEWEQAHVAAFEFLGGAPHRLVCDNLKTGVIKPDLYDPTINRSYQALASWYGCLIDPARPVRPCDKPFVERQVQYVRGSWWRGRQFTSLEHMRTDAARWCLEVAGSRHVRAMPEGSVAEVFNHIERPALIGLPPKPFEVAEWVVGKVAPDCHVSVKGCLYSVPYRLIGSRLDIRLTALMVEFYYQNSLVKTHPRVFDRRRATDADDYPPRHAAWLHKDAAHVRAKAATIGPNCLALIETRMTRANALSVFRSCVGIVSLANTHPAEIVDRACKIALAAGDPAWRTVKNLVDAGAVEPPDQPQGDNGANAMLRGPAAFTAR